MCTDMSSRQHFVFSIFMLFWMALLERKVESLAIHRLIYRIQGSGWTSPDWNWGYAVGTGHTCAAICRDRYATGHAREKLVQNLLNAQPQKDNDDNEDDVEEIKLILALSWQRGRWDGSDGGPGGYGEVLSYMAAAKRYEEGSREERLQRLIDDMANPARFGRLPNTTEQDIQEMISCISQASTPEEGFRKCAGMILRAMEYVERGP